MKELKLFFLLSIVVFSLVGCSKDPETVDEGEVKVDKILYEGKFISSSRYTTSGDVRVILSDGKEKLQFLNFKTDGGPDLRIYLSDDNKATDFIEISKEVKNGNYIVDLPSGQDYAKRPQVLIWCKLFSALFGSAELKKV
jgi:hypothetical protein